MYHETRFSVDAVKQQIDLVSICDWVDCKYLGTTPMWLGMRACVRAPLIIYTQSYMHAHRPSYITIPIHTPIQTYWHAACAPILVDLSPSLLCRQTLWLHKNEEGTEMSNSISIINLSHNNLDQNEKVCAQSVFRWHLSQVCACACVCDTSMVDCMCRGEQENHCISPLSTLTRTNGLTAGC